MRDAPHVAWNACSTMGGERRPIAQGQIAPPRLTPNTEWATDFKGHFRTGDNRRCDPLTVTDKASRHLIATRIVAPTTAGVRGAFEQM